MLWFVLLLLQLARSLHSSVKCLRFATTPQLHLFPFHLQLDSVVPSRKLITVGDLKYSRIASLFSNYSIEYSLFVLRFTNCYAFRISTDLSSLILFGFPLSPYICFVSWYRADSSQSQYCLFLQYRTVQP